MIERLLFKGARTILCLLFAFSLFSSGKTFAKDCNDCQVDLGGIRIYNIVHPTADPCRKGFEIRPEIEEGCDIDYYIWDFGDGHVEISNTIPLHTYLEGGSYTVTVTAVILSDAGRCEFTSSTSLTIDKSCENDCADCELDPGFMVVTPVSGCRYDFSLQGFSSQCPIYGITWDFGDGQTGSSQYVDHVYAGTGPYIACATITVNGLNGTCQRDVCQVIWPEDCEGCARCDVDLGSISNFQNPSNPCQYYFSVSPDIPGGCAVDSYVWDFGDGQQITSGTNAGHTYQGGGPYIVTVTAVVIVDGERCEYSQTRTINSTCPPACSTCNLEAGAIAVDRFERCGYSFSAPGVSSDCGTITYSWDLGDGTTSTASSLDHTYGGANDGTTPQTVALTVTVEENGQTCTRTISTVIWPDCDSYCEFCELDLGSMEIEESPNTNCLYAFTLPGLSSTCQESGLQNLNFLWEYGDGSTGTGVSGSHTFLGPNDGTVTYDVCVTATLTIDGEVCEVTLCKPFTPDCVDPCDECNTTPGNMYLSMTDPCNLRVQIAPGQSSCPLLHYIYDFGDGTTLTSTNLLETHTYAGNDNYQVCVTEVRTGPNGIECTGIYCENLNLISCGTNKNGSSPEALTNWEIAPNRVKVGGTIAVNLPDNAQSQTLELVDLQGRTLRSWSLEAQSSQVQLPNAASAGMYFLRLKGSMATTQRILIYQ